MDPDTLRAMADSGMTRAAMARELGIDQNRLDRQLRIHDIRTKGIRGVPANPKQEAVPVHGVGGQKPPKLMPSAEALALVSVFELGHAPTVDFFAQTNNA